MPREVWLIRGEAGAVTRMSPPLAEGIASRLRSGALVRVNADGSLWAAAQDEAPADPATEQPTALAPATLAEQRAEQQLAEVAETAIEPLPKPDKNARKGDWVKFAASTGRITHEAADNLSKAELIARFGG